LVWQAPPGASLTGALRDVAGKVRDLVGPDARPTICFHRGGWSPKLFAELDAAGFDILTYRKGPKTSEPPSAFTTHTFTDDRGVAQTYELADRRVRIPYDAGKRRFDCRQITRRSAGGHQTQIVTTRTDDVVTLAYAMFSRWRQENFFRYKRSRYDLDALDAYTTVPDDPDRSVPNPAKRAAKDRVLREIFNAPADVQIIGTDLHVRVHPLSAPRRTRALAGLCADLTATHTFYPGTELTLVYTVKQH
jgi:hypothetical protein